MENADNCPVCNTPMVKRTYEYKKGYIKITGYCPKCQIFPEFGKVEVPNNGR